MGTLFAEESGTWADVGMEVEPFSGENPDSRQCHVEVISEKEALRESSQVSRGHNQTSQVEHRQFRFEAPQEAQLPWSDIV